MAKSSSKRRTDRTDTSPKEEKRQRIVTMQALQEMSSDDDDDDGALPPESEWSKEALALKAAIESGTFDAVVTKKDDEEGDPFEEVDLEDDEEEEDEHDDEDAEADKVNEQNGAESDSESDTLEKDNEDDDSESDGYENDDEDKEVAKEVSSDLEKTRKVDQQMDDSEEDDEEEVDSDSDDDEDDDDEDEDPNRSSEQKLTQGKALRIVAASLAAEKKDWPWAETFDIIPPTPLPFSEKDGEGGTTLGVHDDLQRELAFYDLALEAVLEAKGRCQAAGIPFTRPNDFFAEMVKTDDHMARVKDRLIFESKKIEAVAQRKSNTEQKLRAKETQAHKLAEKAKKKRDHFQEVASWAESTKNQDTAIKSKKRAYADQKFGHGGKRGRFKQNDAQSMNNMTGFNKKKGTFTTKPKTMKKNGAGANRKGKRARDASRSR